MKTQGWTLVALMAAAMLAGCDAPEEQLVELRSASADAGPWWETGEPDGDVEVREGDDGDDVPDSILWDLSGGVVSRQIQPGVFTPRLSIEGNQIWAVGAETTRDDGLPTCTMEQVNGAWGTAHRLVGVQGDVIFTLWQDQVYAGGVPVLRFDAASILSGDDDDAALVTASASLDDASPVLQLVLAALVSGECGSAGMP